jgi:hypothetical protein
LLVELDFRFGALQGDSGLCPLAVSDGSHESESRAADRLS